MGTVCFSEPIWAMRWVYGRLLGGVGGSFVVITIFEVGGGSKIGFWHDLWCGDMTLK
jgi:hypothetical protein